MRVVRVRPAAVTAVVAASAAAALLLSGLPAAATDPAPSPSPGSAAAPRVSASATPTTSGTRHAPVETARQRKARKAREAREARQAEEARAAAAVRAAEAQGEQVEEDAHEAAVLVAASTALAEAQSGLLAARQTLAKARDLLATAQAADEQARTDLRAAVLAEQRAARDLDVVTARITLRQRDLGRLARRAYVTNGSMGEWAIVLSSTTPDQLADRLAFLQSIGSAGNAVLADLREDRADLLNAQAGLAAARRWQEEARIAAATALTAVTTRARVAAAAEQQVAAVVKVREAALEQARVAALEDRRQYNVLTAYSGALGARIVSAAAQLAAGPRPPQGSGVMVRPGTGEVTSPFGPRFHPILKYVKVHTGQDFGAADGVVYAADDGVVLLTEYNEAYGNMTVVDHGTVGGLRITTLYAHQAAIGVQVGDRVVKGQALGVIGSTGYSTGPHLHFEVRVNGEPMDPAPFLANAKSPTALP